MSADSARVAPIQEEPAPEVLVSRQAVVDAEMRVVGYRVAYAKLDAGRPDPADRSATHLFGDVLTVVGLEQLVGDAVAHLPLSRELLLTLGIPPVGPDRVLLRLAQDIGADPELREILCALANRGYALAVQADAEAGFELAQLDLFGTVEIDFHAWDQTKLRALLPRVRARHAIPLAAGLLNHADYDRAKALGFEWFTGRFIASPRVTPARNVPVGQMLALAALVQLHGGTAEIEELEQVINRDLGLSLKLLRYMNSAYFGIRNNITSIRQAVMLLGSRGVSRWAMLVALTGGPTAPRELSMMALTRARMCEILGLARGNVDGEELFTLGLLSVSDALLGIPLETIVARLPLADELVEALLHHDGPAGAILDVVLSYEGGNFDAAGVRADRRGVARAYIGALRWAQGVLSKAG